MGELSVESLPRAKATGSACAFQIRGWAAWSPERTTEADWYAWAKAPLRNTGPTPAASPLPVLLRRRVSPLGQAALRAAWGLPDVATARLVSASRHGEYGRTLSILHALAAGEEVSPADFTLSVHHALIGLLSIATHNRHGHTAIAAGPESFGFGLMEAAACLTEKPEQPVVFLYYDEGLPAPYSDFGRSEEPPLALALTLAADGSGETITLETVANPREPANSCRALEFIRFLLTNEKTAVCRGERLCWHWRRHVAAA